MAESSTRRIGDRYVIHGVLASGGMATVHFGRLLGPVGFSRTVAIKQLLPQYATDPEFVSMFVDEARIAARIRHPNVVPSLEVVTEGNEIFIIMDYVHGETLARLLRHASEGGSRIPARIACAIVRDMLNGLHAAHDAKDERGAPLGIIHRDVSPQNTMVGVDGTTRLLDFGIAKARGRSQVTREGQVKGKLAYMAPEQLLGQEMTRSVDIFAAAVVLWESLTGKRLFRGESEGHVVHQIIGAEMKPPSTVSPDLGHRLDAVVMRGLARDPNARYATAREFAQALTQAGDLADASEIGEWVARAAADSLAWRSERLAEVERDSERQKAAAPPDPGADGEPMMGTRGTAFTLQATDKRAVVSPSMPPPRARWVTGALGIVVALATIAGVSRMRAPRAEDKSVAATAAITTDVPAATHVPEISEPRVPVSAAPNPTVDAAVPASRPKRAPVIGPRSAEPKLAASAIPDRL